MATNTETKNPTQPRAVQLISMSDRDPTFQVQPDALEILNSMTGDLAVVAIVGAYRTGKSYLVNRLVNCPSAEGFKVSHRTEVSFSLSSRV